MVVQYCKTYTGRADGETGFTDRTNGTVREDICGSWIKFFNPWKRKFLAKGSFGKFVNPHGPCELKMASRIVRTVRFVKMVYGSWIKFSNPWKSQFVTRGSFEKFVDPYGSYGPYELKMASRIVRTVGFVKRIYGSWIQLFNRWKNQVVTKWSLEKFVDPCGSYELNNGFTDRANRTVREKDLRIVNIVFNQWKNQVVPKWSLEKFVDPCGSCGPYELNNGFTDRANRTVREKDLRIVNIVFNQWKNQVVPKWSLEKFVDPYGPYELKMASRIVYEPYGSWKRFTDREYSFQSVKEAAGD